LGVRRTPRVKAPGNEEAGITVNEYVKISVDNKTSFEKLNPCNM